MARCDDREVTLLVPLDRLDAVSRRALTYWLRHHGIDPASLAIGSAIERDPDQAMLVWRESRPKGQIVRRWRFAPVDGGWPEPFPDTVLDLDQRPAPPALVSLVVQAPVISARALRRVRR